MIIIFLVLLTCIFTTNGMQTHGVIAIPPNKYATNSLEDCGMMQYKTINLTLDSCPHLLNLCNTALNDRSWWKSEFEPVCSLYLKPFLTIYNPKTDFINHNPLAIALGQCFLRLIGLTLKKTIVKLHEITYYQTSIVQYGHFDPFDAASVWLDNKKQEIYSTQNYNLSIIQKRFETVLDPLFFQEMNSVIEKFDHSIEIIQSTNSGLQKTQKEFESCMQSFEQILMKHIERKNRDSSTSNLFRHIVQYSFLFLNIWLHS